MHNVPMLINAALALAYALLGGVVARRLRLPAIVGYILAGVALGPFTPGFTGDVAAIQQLAELGVILLMFGVGLHFSLSDLWLVRDIAIPGALVQMGISTAIGYWMAVSWGWRPEAALVLGIAVSVASTVVLLRGLMDHGSLDTRHGQVAVGWLVLEDLATVAVLVLLPAVLADGGGGGAGHGGGGGGGGWQAPMLAVTKAIVFVALMLVVGKRVIPAVLDWIAGTQSRELFVLVALTAALGTALASAAFFGVSLALGAFVAGVVVSESPFSHQIGADLLPFREAFAVLFFVSVGMLVNPAYLVENWGQVAVLSALIVAGKSLLAVLIGLLFPYPVRTALVVGAGLSQIGEFSFIVGQAGLHLGVLEPNQYSLILAGAIVSITINPWMFRLIDPVERLLARSPRLWARLNHEGLALTGGEGDEPLTGHVVIVGCGRVGRHIGEVLGQIGVPRLVVEASAVRAKELRGAGIPVLFGDAANSEILRFAGLERARSLVVTVSDDAAALMIAKTAHRIAPDLHIVSRASSADGEARMRRAGVPAVVRPELEGGIEIVRRMLLGLGYPASDVQRYTDAVRREGFDPSPARDDRARVLGEITLAAGTLDAGWIIVPERSAVAGQTLGAVNVRARTGASIVAIGRGQRVVSNPGAGELLLPGDRVALIGTTAEIARATQLLTEAGAAPAEAAGPAVL